MGSAECYVPICLLSLRLLRWTYRSVVESVAVTVPFGNKFAFPTAVVVAVGLTVTVPAHVLFAPLV